MSKTARLEITYRYGNIRIMRFSNVAVPDEYGAFLAENLPSGNGSALDLTTGSGFHAIVLASLGYTVTAIDVSAAAVNATRENAALNGVQLSVLQGDLYAPVADQRFDVIVAWPPVMPTPQTCASQSYHMQIHDGGAAGFDILERVLQGTAAALAPGGRLFTLRPWYLDEEKFNRLVFCCGLQCKTLASERFPLGTLSTERLAYLCNLSQHNAEDLYLNGQEMHVVEVWGLGAGDDGQEN